MNSHLVLPDELSPCVVGWTLTLWSGQGVVHQLHVELSRPLATGQSQSVGCDGGRQGALLLLQAMLQVAHRLVDHVAPVLKPTHVCPVSAVRQRSKVQQYWGVREAKR